MEKVWKKEQEALSEQKQVEELRKQYEEARQREEVEAMAVAAGVKKCVCPCQYTGQHSYESVRLSHP